MSYRHGCYICDREIPEKAIHCGRPYCRRTIEAMRRDEVLTRQRLAWRGALLAFRQRCKGCGSFPYYAWWAPALAWLVAIKAAICVLFRLQGYAEREYHVAQVYYATLYAGWEEDCLAVGAGWFTGWCYSITHDGDWDL